MFSLSFRWFGKDALEKDALWKGCSLKRMLWKWCFGFDKILNAPVCEHTTYGPVGSKSYFETQKNMNHIANLSLYTGQSSNLELRTLLREGQVNVFFFNNIKKPINFDI